LRSHPIRGAEVNSRMRHNLIVRRVVSRFNPKEPIDELGFVLMDVLDEFQLSRARAHNEPFHGGFQRFDNVMEKYLIFRCTMTRPATGMVVQMHVLITLR